MGMQCGGVVQLRQNEQDINIKDQAMNRRAVRITAILPDDIEEALRVMDIVRSILMDPKPA